MFRIPQKTTKQGRSNITDVTPLSPIMPYKETTGHKLLPEEMLLQHCLLLYIISYFRPIVRTTHICIPLSRNWAITLQTCAPLLVHLPPPCTQC